MLSTAGILSSVHSGLRPSLPGTTEPVREAFLLPAFGTPLGLASGGGGPTPNCLLQRQSSVSVGLALALPLLAPLEFCHLPVDGSFEITCSSFPSLHLDIGSASPTHRRPGPGAHQLFGQGQFGYTGCCFSSTERPTHCFLFRLSSPPGLYVTSGLVCYRQDWLRGGDGTGCVP